MNSPENVLTKNEKPARLNSNRPREGPGALFKGNFLLFFLLIPAIILIYLMLENFDTLSTQSLLSTKSSEAMLAATIVEEKLNALTDLCVSYASRPLLIKYLEERQWDLGAQIVSDLLQVNKEFDRFVLYDTNAIIQADAPRANVIGQSRADKEWFINFRKTWKPFVSGVYARAAEPKKNVICIVVPVLSARFSSRDEANVNTPQPARLGILQVQLDLKYFHSWANINVGSGGIIYIVDQHGRIVHHPRFEDHSKIVDFSSVRIVKKMLEGADGVSRNYNEVEKEDRIAGFQMVPNYGWGVVVTQPVREAFREKNASLRILIIICILLFCLAISLVLAVRKLFILQQQSARQISAKNSEVEKVNRELQDALDNIKTLKGLLSICAYCKKILNDSGDWQQMEIYVRDHSDADFSHGICPDCMKKYYPNIKRSKTE
jgi:hypothetical protein